jgi:fusion and transport protein UGO1
MIPSLRLLPSFLCPSQLLPITILHSAIPAFVSRSTPLILRSSYGIDPALSPGQFSFFTALSSFVELGIRLPLETVLRRAQITLPFKSSHDSRSTQPIKRTIVKTPDRFRGIVATVWEITRNEREIEKDIRPQGLPGLVKGWKVGAWGAVGLYGAGLTASSAGVSVGEF